MARTKKAAQSKKAGRAAKAEEAPGAPPPTKGRKNKKEAARNDDEQPSPKKRRSEKNDEEEEAIQAEPAAAAAEVAQLKTSPENSDSPLLVFAHGAGASSSHVWMVRWKKLLGEATSAVEVVTFDYPYCANGKKGAPPKAEKLVGSHKEEIDKAMSRHPGHPLVLVGKSMGSRVSCMVAGQEDFKVAAVVCLGYPLKGTKSGFRDQTLLELKAPVLFVQGRKDTLCPLTELEKVREKMTVKSEVHVVEDGDHGLKISKKAGITQEESDRKALHQISVFVTKALTNTL